MFMINIHACRKQHFETIGRIMAMSVVLCYSLYYFMAFIHDVMHEVFAVTCVYACAVVIVPRVVQY